MEKTERYTLIALDLTFFAVAGVMAFFGRLPALPEGWLLPLVGIAAFRGGRAIASNYIFKWLRNLFDVVEVEDSSGAGLSNRPDGVGWKRAVGELVTCPICSGTWVGVGLFAIYSFLPPLGAALIYALGAAGVAELAEWLAEALTWKGRAAREEAGTYWLYKNRPELLRSLEEQARPEYDDPIKYGVEHDVHHDVHHPKFHHPVR